MAQATTTKRKPRPAKGKKPAAVTPIKKPKEEEKKPAEPDTLPPAAASAADSTETEDKKQVRRAVSIDVQAPAVVRPIISSNDLYVRLTQLTPERTQTEVFTSLNDASTELDADPVNVESAMRLFMGLGLCTFIVGRKGRPTRAVWNVGNLAEVVSGKEDAYVSPEKSPTYHNRPLSTVAKVQITALQRAAICKELNVENLDRAGLKVWAEELLQSAIEMIEMQEAPAPSKESAVG